MSVPPALIALAAQIGAPLVRAVLERRLGRANADLAADVMGSISRRLGLPLEQIDAEAHDNPPRVIDAIRETEAAMPEMLALYEQGVEGQFALLKAEGEGAFFSWGWRPAMMWLLALLWSWEIIIRPLIHAYNRGIVLPPADPGTLLSLTGIYMALYMGGHTLKDLARVTRGRE